MKLFQGIALLSASLHTVLAAPAPTPSTELETRQQQCTSPKLRKEWSKATRQEQESYIQAALCLTTKPSRLGLNTTLYDDFSWIHGTLFGQSKFVLIRLDMFT